MGTDIHPIAEVLVEGRWFTVPTSLSRDRNYMSFAVMADVRNGHGFAGVYTHDPIVPISEPRGIPEDSPLMTLMVNRFINYYIDLGDHSYSWLTLKEMESFDLNGTFTIDGEDVRIGDCIPTFIAIMNELRGIAMGMDHDHVRVVFGFDS